MRKLYIVVNPQDQELGRAVEKDGMQAYIRDHVMILLDHATYAVKEYDVPTTELTKATATFVRLYTPEDFIKGA